MSENKYVQTSTEIQLIAVVAVLIALAVIPATVTADPKSHVTVSDVEVSDDEPETGDTVYITPEVSNSGNAEHSVEIDHVKIRTGEVSSGVHDRATHLGTLGSGDSLKLPLTAEFNEAGMAEVTVRVVGTVYEDGGSRGFYVRRPVYIDVQEPSTESETPPRLSVDFEGNSLQPNDEVQVTVSNGDDSALSDLRLHLEGPGVGEGRRVHPRIDEWNSTTFNFTAGRTQQASGEITATLEYDDGEVTVTEEAEMGDSPVSRDEETGESETSGDSSERNSPSLLSGGILGGVLALIAGGGVSKLR